MPSLPAIAVDPLLTNISIAYTNENYVAEQLFPSLPVGPRSGRYYVYGQESFLSGSGLNADGKASTIRKPSARADEVFFDLSKDSYQAERRSLATPVTDDSMTEALEQSGSILQPQIDGTTQVTETMSIDLEMESANLGCRTTNFPSANRELLTTGGSGTSWASYSSTSSDPFRQIRNAKLQIRKGVMREANQMLLTADTAYTLADHPLVKDLIKYTNPEALTMSGLPRVVRGLNLIEGSAQRRTSGEGAAAFTSGNTWVDENGTNIALIFYRSNVLGPRTIHFGRIFDAPDATTKARGFSVRTYRDEPRSSLMVECNRTYDMRLIARNSSNQSVAGYLVSGATL